MNLAEDFSKSHGVLAMQEVVGDTFRRTVEFLPSEFEVMPLRRWNESVLRYFFCKLLATAHPVVDQFVECDNIDLVLSKPPQRAFVEFKFYRHPERYDPYLGTVRGFKGGPGQKNLSDFQKCIEQLRNRDSRSGLSKYVVLVYADPKDGTRPNLRFHLQYDDYIKRHGATSALRLVEAGGPIETNDSIVKAQLYEVG